MNRQFKFRAWDEKAKRMLTPMNVHFTTHGLMEIPPNISLMQFTNCYDKLGNEIWEHDIISQNFQNEFGSFQPSVGTVIFCPNHRGWEAEIEGQHWSIGYDCKVVGNIYQHNYLLHGKAQQAQSQTKKTQKEEGKEGSK